MVLLLTAFYPRRFKEPYPRVRVNNLQYYVLYFYFGQGKFPLISNTEMAWFYRWFPCYAQLFMKKLISRRTKFIFENKEKCGVYRWICLETGESYVEVPIYQEDLINIIV
uniref:Uncharacterized protein n=1 Tax=Morchella brunnea TaxID=1174671 RepID=A0A8K1I7D5_9PEZI|nr:hypothetical protein LK370_mgp227 [Morchella brunnea]UBU98427.1 hypothetical protein [Morchella brunnea]